MLYEEWLSIIEKLKSTNVDYTILNKLKSEPLNTNLEQLLKDKLDNLINIRFELSVNKIIKELDYIFSDINYLDLSLLNFKKEISYLLELIRINQIPIDIQVNQIQNIKEGTIRVYEILIEQANKYDYTGGYALTIRNNMMKRS